MPWCNMQRLHLIQAEILNDFNVTSTLVFLLAAYMNVNHPTLAHRTPYHQERPNSGKKQPKQRPRNAGDRTLLQMSAISASMFARSLD